jgi:Ca2+/Na+ antiporter
MLEKALKLLVASMFAVVLVQVVVTVFFSELADVFYGFSECYVFMVAFFFMLYLIYVAYKLQREYEESCRRDPQLCSD